MADPQGPRGDTMRRNGAGRSDDLVRRADKLLSRASALRQECERLGERREAIAGSGPGTERLRPPEPSEGIRVVATNLALSGATREEVDARLHDAFGMADNQSLLDQVYAAVARAGRGRGRRLGRKR